MLSKKILAYFQGYDPQNITSTGYDYWLYADGHIAVQSHSRWQGSRNGQRWVSDPDFINVSDIGESSDEDAQALLENNVDYIAEKIEEWNSQKFEPLYLRDKGVFRQTRCGEIVY